MRNEDGTIETCFTLSSPRTKVAFYFNAHYTQHRIKQQYRHHCQATAVRSQNKIAPAKEPAKETVLKVQHTAYKAGVIVRTSGPTIILSPPLIVTNNDVSRIVSALDEGLST
jgi:adenosylmethionine-8-amino-7-oxononanoate aminotransferase